ncbi:MAG: DUF4105 domain-containing protein [Ferruginibacter sp.]|nr:DUF4105 domain-containing protein [Ferruginibacter sp.]
MKKKIHPFVVFHLFTFSPFHIFTLTFKYKKILLRLFIISILAHQHISIFAQDSSHLRISLLTCTPGEELYSTFGHTAIRVTDSSSVTDNVFNYGTFNFEDPGFYTKFIRGKLLYYLSVENFQDFKYAYQAENRGITEQVLNLTAEEKIALMQALYENIKDQNKYYQYDFFFDNCTTRPRDMLVKYKKNHPGFKPVMPPGTRFRQAIHQYLDKNGKYWSKLGIDLLLGAPTDAVMTTAGSQFLPDNLMKSLDSSNQDHQLVISTTNLYPINQEKYGDSFLTPLVISSFLLFLVIVISFSTNNWAKIFLQGFDGIFFFLTGAMGILLIFMWIGTDHSMTKSNYNLLWAWPLNAISAFFINSKKKWAHAYFGFNAAALIIVLLSWFFLPQQMNNALIPIVLLLVYRSAGKYFRPHRF